MNQDGFWTCRIGGRLWLMFKTYRVCVLAECWADVEAALEKPTRGTP